MTKNDKNRQTLVNVEKYGQREKNRQKQTMIDKNIQKQTKIDKNIQKQTKIDKAQSQITIDKYGPRQKKIDCDDCDDCDSQRWTNKMQVYIKFERWTKVDKEDKDRQKYSEIDRDRHGLFSVSFTCEFQMSP